MKTQRKKNRVATNRTETGTPVNQRDIVTRVWELADPLCASEGLELIHIEYQREPAGWVLRLYIEKPGGVTIDDCAAVSRQLGDILDIKLDTAFPYMLEVSSPGAQRPLSRLTDFEKFKGKAARIRTRRAIEGQKNFKGVLLGILGDNVLQMLDKETVAIPYQEITKARLVNNYGDDKC